MAKKNIEPVFELILREDKRYAKGAYIFVRKALDYTVNKLCDDHTTRHITGAELLEGIREFALQEYGPMTKCLLAHWGIHKCEDFGEIVFTLVEYGILGKTAQDKREDFAHGYDFREAFEEPFLPSRSFLAK